MNSYRFSIILVSLGSLMMTSSCASSSISISDTTSNASSAILTTEIYQNPIYNENFPDPSIIRHSDGFFYAYSTGSHIIKSMDLVNWSYVAQALPTRPTWGSDGAGIWAPDVAYINGQYVMYYSLSRWDDTNPGIGIATAPHPEGPWTDLGKFFLSSEIGVNNSIDAMAFRDSDDRLYLVWGSFRGIYAIELSSNGLDFKDENVAAAAQNKIHLAGYETSRALDVNTFEGAYIIRKNGYYYLFLSNGQCCSGSYSYNVRVGRSASVLGPYEDSSGRNLLGGDVGSYVVYGNSVFSAPGHNAVVTDDEGVDWMLYHAFAGDDRSKRVLLMDKLTWDANGFPSLLGFTPTNNRKTGPAVYR